MGRLKRGVGSGGEYDNGTDEWVFVVLVFVVLVFAKFVVVPMVTDDVKDDLLSLSISMVSTVDNAAAVADDTTTAAAASCCDGGNGCSFFCGCWKIALQSTHS